MAIASTLKNCEEAKVLDLVFITVTVVFFIVSIGYVAVCDRLMK